MVPESSDLPSLDVTVYPRQSLVWQIHERNPLISLFQWARMIDFSKATISFRFWYSVTSIAPLKGQIKTILFYWKKIESEEPKRQHTQSAFVKDAGIFNTVLKGERGYNRTNDSPKDRAHRLWDEEASALYPQRCSLEYRYRSAKGTLGKDHCVLQVRGRNHSDLSKRLTKQGDFSIPR